MKSIAVSNQKGGVSKTTTSIHLAIGLAKQGNKVLIIDTDAQSSLSIALGCEITNDNEITISTHLEDLINNQNINALDGIIEHEEGIDIMPANLDLVNVQLMLQQTSQKRNVFSEYLSLLGNEYDYVIFDTSPNLSLITLNVLSCVDSVLIPIQLEYLVIKGLDELLSTIQKLKKKKNPKIEVLGIAITMANMNTKISKQMYGEITKECDGGIRIFDSIVPKSIKVVESSYLGVSIYEHNKDGKVAIAYENLVKEILSV